LIFFLLLPKYQFSCYYYFILKRKKVSLGNDPKMNYNKNDENNEMTKITEKIYF